MSRFLVLLMVIASGCSSQKPAAEDIAKEKEAVKAVIADFSQAYQSKDLAGVTKLISSSGEFLFFGTDSAEVLKSKADFETQMNNDWQLFESAKLGEPRNLSIQMSNDGQLAFAIYEASFDATIGGQPSHSLVRFAHGMRKEEGQWRFIQGMAAFATVGQSSAEMAAKMKEAK
jgi:ketosteroid isomerase-like protein